MYIYIYIYTHTHIHTHTHTQEGGFSFSTDAAVWYDADSDVCLASSMLGFGLSNASTSLDFLALHLFSPECQRIPINLADRIVRVGRGEPLNVICRGLDETTRGEGSEKSVTPWNPGHGARSPLCSWTALKSAWAEYYAGPGQLTGHEREGPRP